MKTFVSILHIYGALAIFQLLFNHQDTESEAWWLENGVSGPIFTHENIKISMGQQYPYPTRWENVL